MRMCREENGTHACGLSLDAVSSACRCCVLVGTALTSRFMAAEADEPIVALSRRAPFHVPVFANEYVQMLKVEIPAGRWGLGTSTPSTLQGSSPRPMVPWCRS